MHSSSIESPSGPVDAASAAAYYRARHGWNPLPSRADRKRPELGSYAEYWDTPIERTILANWTAPNVQLMCGSRWRLGVIDLDGELAVSAWQSLTLHRDNPRTWMVKTGSGNWHLYYALPDGLDEFPSRLVWDGGEKHQRIDLLGDRSLVIAPPSLHIETGRPYQFAIGPSDMPEPAQMPEWAVSLSDCRSVPEPAPMPVAAATSHDDAATGHFSRRAVLDAISDKVALVRSWGLRILGRRPDHRGWWRCRAIGRADRCPSAGFHGRSGYYSEPPNRRMSIFDLAVYYHRYGSLSDAINGLGGMFVRGAW